LLGALSPWTQAPLLLLRFPALFVAVAAAMSAVAIAAAAGPLFLSSAGNAALRRQAETVTTWNGGLTVAATGPVAGRFGRDALGPLTAEGLFQSRDSLLRDGVEGLKGLGPAVVTIIGSQSVLTSVRNPKLTVQVRPLNRSDALLHVERIAGAGGDGLWITDDTAKSLRVQPGDMVWLSQDERKVRVQVAGIYKRIDPAAVPEFWSSLTTYIKQLAPDGPPLAALAIAEDATFRQIEGRLKDNAVFRWEFPLETDAMTLEDGRALGAGLEQLELEIRSPGSNYGNYFAGPSVNSLFPALLAQADTAARSLKGPVDALSLAGEIAALFGVGTVGIYWVRRRRVEFRHLIAKGVRSASSGTRSILEAALPGALGAAAGWLLVGPLVRALGPTHLISPAATDAASRALVRGEALSLGLIGVVVILGIRREARPGSDRTRQVVVRMPWEVVFLVLAGAVLYELSSRGTAVIPVKGGPPKVDKLLILFPILFVAGGAGLAVRALRIALTRFRGLGRRRSTPVFLAFRRLAAASGVGLILVAASALALGNFVFSASMASSVSVTVDAKALTYVGSDVAVQVGGAKPVLPAGLAFPATLITRYGLSASLAPSRSLVEILGVDRRTFAGAAFWDPSFSASSLPDLLAKLDQGVSDQGAIPVLVLGEGEIPRGSTLVSTGVAIPVRVVGVVRAFPGASAGQTVVIADRDILPGVISAAVERANSVLATFHEPLVPTSLFPSSVELWAKGEPGAVVTALRASGVHVIRRLTADQVRSSPAILVLQWTFGYMQMVGLAIGSIALIGIILYVQASRRSREISYALSRRMGLTAPSHAISLALELISLVASAFVIGTVLSIIAARLTFTRLDPVPSIRPSILLRVPTPLLGLTAAGLLIACSIGALLAQREAGRMKVAEVMRLGA
jgi:putative ABC transport system permease protein